MVPGEMVMAGLCAVLLVLLIGLAAGPARATQAGQQAIKNWALMDKCTRNAQAAFPDYTAQAYAQRNAALKACLEGNNLPPREPEEPQK